MRILVMFLFTALLLTFSGPATAQDATYKQITVEDIWLHSRFSHKSVPGFRFLKDGRHYSKKEGDAVLSYDIVTGKLTDTLFNASDFEVVNQFKGYSLSEDETKLLIRTETVSIYRRSTKSVYYVYDREKRLLEVVTTDGKIMHCIFSPDGNYVGYVFENDLYSKELSTGRIWRITSDGVKNKIINGSADWVYEEEFGFSQAFEWSPDSRRIAFYRFDESRVPEFTMTNYTGELYPEYETFKYPKVGEENSTVEILVHNIDNKKTIGMNISSEPDGYIPRIKWTNDPSLLCIFKMNRHQNHLSLRLANVESGTSRILFEETNKYFIDIHDNLRFLSDGNGLIWTSEMDGWNHIYYYSMDGKQKYKLTEGDYDVTDFYGVDEKNGLVYFQAAAVSPLEREVYTVDLQGKHRKKISEKRGTTSAQFSGTFDYYTLNYRTANMPSVYAVYDRSGRKLRMLEDNAELQEKQEEYGVTDVEYFQFTTSQEVDLNGWMIKPPDFDPDTVYPVFMYLYGGPGSQEVLDDWIGTNYWWFQMLAQQGFIVACVDNRGTGARGEDFRKMTYMQLGHYETIDQIEAAKYLGRLDYTDPSRIGIFGWSYGGYMSSLCILKGSGVFKAAIAVAPVTNWKWYDTIYTERYMRTYQENPDGYADNSPVNFAKLLAGDYLLVHGGSDDNVHFQHSAEMAKELIKANKQFDTYYYPNRNHSIHNDNARLHLYTKMTNFIQESLGDKSEEEEEKPGPGRS